MPYVMNLARHGWRDAVRRDAALREGVNVVNGEITYGSVADAHGLPSVDITTLL
jgi:alanine dehydrogenase